MKRGISSIGRKIGAGFLSLFLIFVVIMAVSHHQIKSVEQLVSVSVMEKADARSVSNSIVMECFQTLTFAEEFLKTADPRRKTALRIIIADEMRTMQEYMGQIGKRSLTAAEKDKFSVIQDTYQSYSRSLESLLNVERKKKASSAETVFHDRHQHLITELLQFNTLETNLMYDSWEYAKAKINSIRTYSLFLSLLAFIVSMLLGFIITRTITRPVLVLVRTLEKFGAGNFKARAEIQSSDEIGFMAGKFNAMCDDLEKINQQLVDIIDFLPDATFVLDRSHRVIAWNHAIEEMSGVSKEQILGKGNLLYSVFLYGSAQPLIADMILDPSIDIRNRYQRYIEKGNKRFAEIHVSTMNGGRGGYISIIASPLFDAGGHLIGAIESFRDISEQKVAEEALRKSEEYARTLFDLVNDAIFVQDVETAKIYDVNKKMCEMYGYTREEACSSIIESLSAGYHPYTNRDALEWVKKSASGPQLFEWLARDRLGRLFWCEVNMKRAVIADNERLLVVVRDISERKKAAEALSEEKERLSVTLRSIGEGVIAADENQTVVIVNKIAEQMTGFTQEEAVGRRLSDIFLVSDHKSGSPFTDAEGNLDTGEIMSRERKLVITNRKDGRRLIDCCIAPIFDSQSRTIGTIIVFQDVTEKDKMEAELLKTQKLESLGIFAGGIAHDFNNIMMGILGNVSLLKAEEKENEAAAARLSDVEKAVFRAKELTRQLLTFSKGGNPVKKTVAVSRLVREAAAFVLSGSNVKCEFSIPDDLPSADVDEGQISQVINNLLINANQAMPGGGIIRISIEKREVGRTSLPLRPGTYLHIAVQDHGTGISKENLAKIFDPFFTTKPKGNGLGLSTSYSIVQRHGGCLTAESEEGCGAIFHIWLPASGSETMEEHIGGETIFTEKKKALLMDDDELILQVGAQMLSRLGMEVECARDGKEAIELFRKAKDTNAPFDVVIMDLTIPAGMGGKEAITELLKIDPAVKAVVSSGYSNDQVISSYRKYGFSAFIIKPYKLEDLSEALRPLLHT